MAKDDDVSIFDELDDKLDDFFADDDDLFSEDGDVLSEGDDELAVEDDSFEDDSGEDYREEPDSDVDILQSQADDNGGALDPADTTVTPPVEKEYEQTDDTSGNPLQQLKAIVLEMDWEISDENLEKYLAEINRLIVSYQNDRPIYLFFKLHAAIGEYMLKKKARAHPDALKFLYSVYNSLEKALKDDVPLVEKNKMILAEVNNFKSLKKKLFPGFYSKASEENIMRESGGTVERSSDKTKSETASFDISSLPEDVQNGVNDYIEKMIAKKIESMNKST